MATGRRSSTRRVDDVDEPVVDEPAVVELAPPPSSSDPQAATSAANETAPPAVKKLRRSIAMALPPLLGSPGSVADRHRAVLHPG